MVNNMYLKNYVPYFYDLSGEYTVQHNQQLGEPGKGGAHLSVLWKKLSLESCLGETHTETT